MRYWETGNDVQRWKLLPLWRSPRHCCYLPPPPFRRCPFIRVDSLYSPSKLVMVPKMWKEPSALLWPEFQTALDLGCDHPRPAKERFKNAPTPTPGLSPSLLLCMLGSVSTVLVSGFFLRKKKSRRLRFYLSPGQALVQNQQQRGSGTLRPEEVAHGKMMKPKLSSFFSFKCRQRTPHRTVNLMDT